VFSYELLQKSALTSHDKMFSKVIYQLYHESCLKSRK